MDITYDHTMTVEEYETHMGDTKGILRKHIEEVWLKYPDVDYCYCPGKRVGNIVEVIRIKKAV